MGGGWTFYSPYSSHSGGWDLLDVLVALLVLLTFACAVGLIGLWWRVLCSDGRVEPRCGGCRYPVRGLRALTCPECGRDFFDVGIDVRRRRMVGPFAFVVIWVLLFPLPAVVVWSLLTGIGPQTPYTEPAYELSPASGNYDVTLMSGMYVLGPGVWWTTPADRVHLVDVHIENSNGSFGYLSADLTAKTATGMTGAVPVPLDAAAVDAAMRSAGLNPTDPATATEAAELLRILDGMTATGLALPTSTAFTVTDQSHTFDTPSPWFGTLVSLAMLLVWAVGFVLYVLVWRRRFPKPERRTAQVAAVQTA